MSNNLEYYFMVIKPLEKKYSRMCTLYSIFKLNLFKKKRNKYNMIINNYYSFLLNNKDSLEEIQNSFKF